MTPIDSQGRMQADANVPIVEDPSLPTMDAESALPSAAIAHSSEKSADADVAGPAANKHSSKEGGLMEPFVAAEEPEDGLDEGTAKYMAPAAEEEGQAYPDQQEAPGAAPLEPEEGYVRLTFKVEDGQMSIAEAKGVGGPLMAEKADREGEMVYEVTRKDRRLAAGIIPPDAHLARGMAHPEATGELAGHHISELSSFEFTTRLQKRDLPFDALHEVGAAVYRVKGGEPLGVPTSAASLRETAAGERLRIVAELRGVDLETLSPEVQEDLRRALK